MSASRDKSIRMWDASTGQCLVTLVSCVNERVILLVNRGPSLDEVLRSSVVFLCRGERQEKKAEKIY